MRTPKNDQATARSVRSSEPLRGDRRRRLPSSGCAIMSRPPVRRGGARRAACAGSAGILPPTSKKVYDRVIVFTSFGSFGSITNTTGHCFDSPGFSTCSLKQKHSSLLKCDIACAGA